MLEHGYCSLLHRSLPTGTRPFDGINGSKAVSTLRAILAMMDVKEAKKYRTHDLRRGHAEDMKDSGAPLVEILKAGDWRLVMCAWVRPSGPCYDLG